ncbi:hypothetical protein HAX54_018828 [Datura stramonium]|uniref:Putative plant transposon protein domain-containing protein n=1 Tax=Datura stramonium TaxID=4076 RepID=A0ABS8UNW1_DATST|nr:hypothetical protein [Datura stramonium]
MSEAPGRYFLNIVHDFYVNYTTTLDKNHRKGQKVSKLPILNQIRVHRVMVYISNTTINRILYGPHLLPPVRTPEFDHRLKDRNDQRPGLAQVLTDGQSPWLTNPREKIYKSTLTFAAMFWWVVVRLRLFPTGGLCKSAHVPILVGINVEIVENKKNDFDKSKDETNHDLYVHMTMPLVFGPSKQIVRAVVEQTNASDAVTVSDLAFVASPLPTYIPSKFRAGTIMQSLDSTETSSVTLQTSHYALMPTNFAELVKGKTDIRNK